MDGINVLLNILCRLPVKSLKRFQCASKSWHDLIHKPDFITQHLHVFNSSRKFDDERRRHSSCLLVNGLGTRWDRSRPTRFLHKAYVNLLHLDETSGEVNSRHVLNLPLDYEDENPGVQILGPCNGLYCLHRTNEYDMVHVIAVVNVALRQVKLVPEPNIPLPLGFQQMRYGTHCVGFGFDPKTSDYKFVLVRVCYLDSWDGEYVPGVCRCYVTKPKSPCLFASHNDRPHYTSQIVVYSLSCNSWKNVDDYVHDNNLVELEYEDVSSGGFQCSTYLDGVCYWWMYSNMLGDRGSERTEPGDYWTLVYFNLADQVLGQMRLPPEMLVFDDSDGKLLSRAGSISVYEESLCLIITMGDWTTDMHLAEDYKPGFPYFDIWVMHHPDCSWTKQFTIQEPIKGLSWPFGFFSSSGQLFILDMIHMQIDQTKVNGRLVVYYPSTQQCTNFHVSRPDETGNSFGVTAYAYSESLVSVIGDVRDDQNMLFTITQDHLFHDLTALGKRSVHGSFRFWNIQFEEY